MTVFSPQCFFSSAIRINIVLIQKSSLLWPMPCLTKFWSHPHFPSSDSYPQSGSVFDLCWQTRVQRWSYSGMGYFHSCCNSYCRDMIQWRCKELRDRVFHLAPARAPQPSAGRTAPGSCPVAVSYTCTSGSGTIFWPVWRWASGHEPGGLSRVRTGISAAWSVFPARTLEFERRALEVSCAASALASPGVLPLYNWSRQMDTGLQIQIIIIIIHSAYKCNMKCTEWRGSINTTTNRLLIIYVLGHTLD